ncbi:hydroxysqualene dehydroxylase HpnE [Noviherbaspirillum soli]|uniref:hydroxysqualene dehydroxylase HpnE n=1 Tax=Noviherbaspirillum soli TaxID=1064518 RepID=UPI00188B99BD|nr:hydroxysqualene dehydroxylase HpnE [Noviherbaspirillum soli]
MTAPRVAVVGGGWAGCAAAVALAARGASVTLYEASRTLGGRARVISSHGRALDNGQHILLGAYGETLRLLRLIGVKEKSVLLRLPLQMCYPDGTGMTFIAPRLPAPWHVGLALLRARGLRHADRMALARFSTAARWMGWQLNQDCTVGELLQRHDQTDTLVRLMWRPLCLAALNTPPERASARIFLNVLRDSLGARRSASDMLLPRVDLSALFPQHAAMHIERHGGRVLYGARVERLERGESGWRLGMQSQDQAQAHDAVVLATAPAQAAALLAGLTQASVVPAFDWEAITTVYLQYAASIRLPRIFLALEDAPEAGHWGQFVFDRGQLNAADAGLLAVVVSVSGAALEQGNEALAAQVAAQLAQVLRMPALAAPQWSRVISEKRATFACTPDLQRPPNDIGIDGLALAGDYTASDYPATLESAVRSGTAAARLVLQGVENGLQA